MNVHPQRILAVFGTRPEAIKLAPLIRELESDPSQFSVRVCVTAQHRSLLDGVLETFRITPHYDLGIMEDGQEPLEVIYRCLNQLQPVLNEERPDWVLVQGDTSTTLAASLAAAYRGVRLAHVEAGLRTGNNSHPFPEEISRRLTSQLASLHFAPTPRAKENLLREGIEASAIHVTGNTGIDALFYARQQQPPCLPPIPGLEQPQSERPLLLVTSHRRESFGEGLRRICQALREIALRGDVDVVFPVHLNPSVQQSVLSLLGDLPNVFLLEPLDYVVFVALMERAYLILTDSGGIQEEAPSLGKPVLVLREVTERPEAVEAGLAKLVSTDPARIVAETLRLLEDPQEYAGMSRPMNLFGDGQASARIAQTLASQTR
ncbi:MAG: UDP-N-acetylglucosamine 2-epimerase (non-hydrolyzing) [Acidobacteria bacterium]|nr:UDP-N-acetylglucosamine 2-epimerase (non-hydrolyzing) [Acidobacteriota bacterium]